MAKVNKKTFREALKNSGGNQSHAAKKLGVTRAAIGKFLKKNPDMKELLIQERELIIDIAEDNINMAILVDHDIEASKWKLLNSKLGRARGYGKKQEIETFTERPSIIHLIEKSNEEIKEERQAEIKRLLGKN